MTLCGKSICFEDYFPKTVQLIEKLEHQTDLKSLLKDGSDESRSHFYRVAMEEIRLACLEEISSVIGQVWLDLQQINKGFVAVHTLLVLWRALKHTPQFNKLSAEEQNMVKWACLLHDVRKLSVPIIEGKDHVHPFKSAISTLEVFEKLGFVEASSKNKECLMQARRLIGESVQPIPARM